MALDVEQQQTLKLVLEGCKEQPGQLSEWETTFIQSLIERVDTYGLAGVRLSEKQWAIIERIYPAVV